MGFFDRTQLISIDQIVFDETIYPRCSWGWVTAYDYAQSMKAGAVFPPITVAEYGGKFILIDGKHRVEANKSNKQKHIQCEVLKGLTKQQMFLEAIKRNIINSRPLTPQDKAGIIIHLKEMKDYPYNI